MVKITTVTQREYQIQGVVVEGKIEMEFAIPNKERIVVTNLRQMMIHTEDVVVVVIMTVRDDEIKIMVVILMIDQEKVEHTVDEGEDQDLMIDQDLVIDQGHMIDQDLVINQEQVQVVVITTDLIEKEDTMIQVVTGSIIIDEENTQVAEAEVIVVKEVEVIALIAAGASR